MPHTTPPPDTELALIATASHRCGHWPRCHHTAIGLSDRHAHEQLEQHYRDAHPGQPHPHPGLAAWRRHRSQQ